MKISIDAYYPSPTRPGEITGVEFPDLESTDPKTTELLDDLLAIVPTQIVITPKE